MILQKSPAVGHRQRGAVGDGDDSVSVRAVEHAAEIYCGGGEVEVGVVDLGVQLHRVLMRVFWVVDIEELECNV